MDLDDLKRMSILIKINLFRVNENEISMDSVLLVSRMTNELQQMDYVAWVKDLEKNIPEALFMMQYSLFGLEINTPCRFI